MSLTAFLWSHIAALAILLGVIAWQLIRRKLFNWITIGFWTWVAFTMYFVLSPLSAILGGNISPYKIRWDVVGGANHAIWISSVIAVGIVAFYATYFKAIRKTKLVANSKTWKPQLPLIVLWLFIFIGFGGYSLLASRAGIASWNGEVIITGGRFTGSVSGYQTAGYIFLVFPTVLLLLWPTRIIRTIGSILAVGFMYFSLPHAWSRYVTISMLLAVILVFLVRKKKSWPHGIVIVLLLVFTLIYQARGHTTWQFVNIFSNISESWGEVKDKGLFLIGESDTLVLPTLWVESHWVDQWAGYNYGIPLINYAMTGWIPGRIFPQKYFLIDWLKSTQSASIGFPAIYGQLLFGAKSTLIGSMYQMGGMIAVIIGMAIFGVLGRRMDRMLAPTSSLPNKALGISWLSILWMVWASSDVWGLMAMGSLAIPYIAGVLLFFKPAPSALSSVVPQYDQSKIP